MDFTRKEMISIIREEYEKRVQYYSSLSEIEIKDKDDNNLIDSAKGLKVKDKAGFVFTIHDIISDESGKEVVRLIGPGEGSSLEKKSKATASMLEDESNAKQSSDKKVDIVKSNEIIPRSDSKTFKRSFETDIQQKSVTDMYDDHDDFYHVPMSEFEKAFSI